MLFLFIVAGILLIAALLIFSNACVLFEYHGENNITLHFKYLFLCFQIYPSKDDKKEKKRKEKKENPQLSFIQMAHLIFESISRIDFVRIYYLNIKVVLGKGDAAETGISIGGLYASLYSILGLLQNVIYIKKPEINIIPDYSGKTEKVDCELKLKGRVISIIKALLKIMKTMQTSE